MKKFKYISVILALSFTLFAFTACPGGGIMFGVHPNLPWGGDASLITEIKTFSVYVYCAQTPPTETGARLVLARGEVVQTLTGCDGVSYGSLCSISERGTHIHITTRMEITWEDETVPNHPNIGANRGLRDVLYSDVTFVRNSLEPLTSRRHLNAQTRPVYGGRPSFNNSHYVRTNFESEPRYISGVQTTANTSSIQIRQNTAGAFLNPVQHQTLPDTTLFCNEQLHYLIRGLQAVTPGSGITVPTHNAVENYIRYERASTNRQRRNAFVPTPVTLGAAAQVGLMPLNSTPAIEENTQVEPAIAARQAVEGFDFLGHFLDKETAAHRPIPNGLPQNVIDDMYTVLIDGTPHSLYIPIVPVTINLAQTPAGPTHTFFVTAPDVSFSNGQIHTSRLILQYGYSMFNIYGSRIFDFVYTLTDYSVE